MKKILHYEQKEPCNKAMPSLSDPRYKDRIRECLQLVKYQIDNECWKDSRWCETFTEMFVDDVKKCNLFVDVGAEVGFYTYLALKYMPHGGEIIAFEPDPIRYSLLKEFFSPYGNVKVYDFAVYDVEGVATFVKPPGLSATLTNVDGETFEVRTIRLDDFLRDKKIDIIKIDIEGAEANAFGGMQKILSQGSTRIYLELHNWVNDICPGGVKLMEQLLVENGYNVYNSYGCQLVFNKKLKEGRYYLIPKHMDDKSNLLIRSRIASRLGNIYMKTIVLDLFKKLKRKL